MYYLMDLERTITSGIPCFWKRHKRGYSYKIEFAGLYSKEAADDIVKNDFDNRTIMIHIDVISKILGEDLKENEGS